MADSIIKAKELLAINIKALRKKKGISQEELAEIINLSSQSISDIEGRRTWVSDKTLEGLAKAFDVDIFQLFVPTIEGNDSNQTLVLYDQLQKLRADIKEDIDKRLDQFFLSEKSS
ncbi:MAG: helix-turn-helix transcriptional regulator [Treponema sp.]|nr:helix-turn-helix transcriptional regulator [Treponema sp.]